MVSQNHSGTLPSTRDRSALQKKAVVLCGRMASRFIHAGVTVRQHCSIETQPDANDTKRLSCYFKSGRFALFDGLPRELSRAHRIHLPLFIATLVQNNIFDFKDIDVTVFELWITLIIAPLCDLAFEEQFGEALRRHDFPYVEKAIPLSRNNPQYNTNRNSFACCIRHMRNSLRHADSNQRRNLRAEFAAMLKLVMQQMREHFKSLEMDSAEHHLYIGFVREIIALIKSYGADICAVDDYYYQPSREYAPSMEDPQLHTAGIIAYGIRLGEGETTASPQLFYYLLNNFKTAMVNDRLIEERKMLEKGMQNSDVLVFVVNRMLPAIIQATVDANSAWPLLHVYCGALKEVLIKSSLPREIPYDNVEDVMGLLEAILIWVEKVREREGMSEPINPFQLYSFIQMMSVCNTLAPSLMCWSCQASSRVASDLDTLIAQINLIVDDATSYLSQLTKPSDADDSVTAIYAKDLLAGVVRKESTVQNSGKTPQVQTFAQHIATDVSRNWISTSNTITIKVPVKAQGAPGTQSGQGTMHDLCTRTSLVKELCYELRIWSTKMSFSQGGKRRRRARRPMQDFIV